jgi:hypothetical protein
MLALSVALACAPLAARAHEPHRAAPAAPVQAPWPQDAQYPDAQQTAAPADSGGALIGIGLAALAAVLVLGALADEDDDERGHRHAAPPRHPGAHGPYDRGAPPRRYDPRRRYRY